MFLGTDAGPKVTPAGSGPLVRCMGRCGRFGYAVSRRIRSQHPDADSTYRAQAELHLCGGHNFLDQPEGHELFIRCINSRGEMPSTFLNTLLK